MSFYTSTVLALHSFFEVWSPIWLCWFGVRIRMHAISLIVVLLKKNMFSSFYSFRTAIVLSAAIGWLWFVLFPEIYTLNVLIKAVRWEVVRCQDPLLSRERRSIPESSISNKQSTSLPTVHINNQPTNQQTNKPKPSQNNNKPKASKQTSKQTN